MKTPDEIKKGLECCAKGNSCRGKCPYDGRSAGIKECTSQLARDALTIIPRWISVDDRLPEELMYVLAIDYYDEHSWEPCIAYVQEGQWLMGELLGVVRRITHWMPLPEPPKEEHKE